MQDNVPKISPQEIKLVTSVPRLPESNCPGCTNRDHLNRSLAKALDRAEADNARLRAGRERAA